MTDSQAAQDFLAHTGVLGMHWGVRKDGSPRSTTPRKIGAPTHEDKTVVKNLRQNPTHALSNSDLRKINERMQLEQTYAQLKGNQSSLGKIKKGNDAAKIILGVAGTAGTIYGLSQSVLGQKAIAAGKKVLAGKI